MGWKETLGVMALFIVLLQGVNWILMKIGLEEMDGDILTFLISAIFISLITIVVILIEQNSEIKGIKKKLGIKKDSGFIEKMIGNKKKNKKGNIDPRILLGILIAILLYLFLKSIGINLFGIN